MSMNIIFLKKVLTRGKNKFSNSDFLLFEIFLQMHCDRIRPTPELSVGVVSQASQDYAQTPSVQDQASRNE